METNALALDVVVEPLAHIQPIALQGGAITIANHQLYVLDRLGQIWLYGSGKVRPSGLPDLPMNIAAFLRRGRFPLDEGTLKAHDIRTDPLSGDIYASFDAYDANDDSLRFTIAKVVRPSNAAPVWRTVFRSPEIPCTEFYSGRGAGGKMAFTGKTLIFAVGDYNLDTGTNPVAQDAKAFPGKIYELDLTSLTSRRLSLGHRVPGGLAIAKDGKIWETENGPRGGDELNRVADGANYGWPYATIGQNYFRYGYVEAGSVADWLVGRATGRRKNMVSPVHAWVPSVAPTAIIELQGFDAAWDGDLLIASLKGQSLYRVRMEGDRVLFVEAIWMGRRIRDMIQAKGQIILWTDDGALIVLSPARNLIDRQVNREPIYDDSAVVPCGSCHAFSGDFSPFGPSLKGVYGRRIASDNYPHYSKSLRALSGSVWEEGSLTQFLKNPAAVAPGTSMPALGLTDAEIARVVAALKAESARADKVHARR